MSKPLISLIVARNDDNVIGLDNEIPWHLPNDMRFFKVNTMGKIVIMGRKTYESIPEKFRPFPGRHTIVITRNAEWDEDGVFVVDSPMAALNLADSLMAGLKCDEIMIAGGGEIYKQLQPMADRMYITQVDCPILDHVSNSDNMAYFPEVHPKGWKIEMGGGIDADEKNLHHHEFNVWDRIKEELPPAIETDPAIVEQGARAFLDGNDIDKNPYTEPGAALNTDALSWECGWMEQSVKE